MANLRDKIVSALKLSGNPMRVGEILDAVSDIKRDAVDQTVHRLADDGVLTRISRGVYALSDATISDGEMAEARSDEDSSESAMLPSVASDAVADCKRRIMAVYQECHGEGPLDIDRISIWLERGDDLERCASHVEATLRKWRIGGRGRIVKLSFFDNASPREGGFPWGRT